MEVGEDLQEDGRGGHSQAGRWTGALSGDPGCWGRTCAGGGGVRGSALLRWTKEGTLDMPWVRTLLIADLVHMVQSHELKPPAVEGPGVPEMTKKLVH